MATYASRADVQIAAGGLQRLLQISDQDDDGVEDTDLVTAAIDEAEGIVNSYARKRFEVPFTTVPESIRRITAHLAVYTLKSWRDALTEQDAIRQEQRLGWLEHLARGVVDPGISPSPAPSAHNQPSATDRPSTKAVSRENLKGFW